MVYFKRNYAYLWLYYVYGAPCVGRRLRGNSPRRQRHAQGAFFLKFPSEKNYLLIETSSGDEQALSVVVERSIVILKVVGSNPDSFFLLLSENS